MAALYLRTAKTPGVNRANLMGIVRPPADAILPTDDEELPLMAVVRTTTEDIDIEQRSFVQTFVLLRQSRGLCTPYMVSQEHVFCMPQFRRSTTDMKSRGRSWNDLVVRYAILSSDKAHAPKHIPLSKARDHTKFYVCPTASFRNELVTLATSYEVCWPGLKVTAEELFLLQKAVTTGNVTLEHRWLETFVGEATYRVAKENTGVNVVSVAATTAQESPFEALPCQAMCSY